MPDTLTVYNFLERFATQDFANPRKIRIWEVQRDGTVEELADVQMFDELAEEPEPK